MTQSHLPRLQKIVDAIAAESDVKTKSENLNEAFRLFSSETQALLKVHQELKERYQKINFELAAANLALQQKVAELGFASSYLNCILDNIALGIIFVDKEGIVITYNAAAAEILGVKSDKVLFQNYWENFTDQFLGFSMNEALSKRSAINQTNVLLPDLKPQRLVEVNAVYVAEEETRLKESDDPSKKPQGLVVSIQDISEIKRLESSILRNDKTKELGQIAAMVAHEIRNPLGGIKGFASLLQRDLESEPELQRLATYIVEGTDSLNRLVNDILDYSHPVKLFFEKTDLVHLMSELILHLNADEGIDPRIELHTYSTADAIFADVDALSLKSAVMNLASNAIQAMPEGGELRIDVDQNKHDTFIKVTDTGMGIPPENMEKIFMPFFTTRQKGHGLGLAEVHRIVQAHEGSLDVASEVGKGSTFTIKLPLKRKSHDKKIHE